MAKGKILEIEKKKTNYFQSNNSTILNLLLKQECRRQKRPV